MRDGVELWVDSPHVYLKQEQRRKERENKYISDARQIERRVINSANKFDISDHVLETIIDMTSGLCAPSYDAS